MPLWPSGGPSNALTLFVIAYYCVELETFLQCMIGSENKFLV
jgi:hypothetical protein